MILLEEFIGIFRLLSGLVWEWFYFPWYVLCLKDIRWNNNTICMQNNIKLCLPRSCKCDILSYVSFIGKAVERLWRKAIGPDNGSQLQQRRGIIGWYCLFLYLWTRISDKQLRIYIVCCWFIYWESIGLKIIFWEYICPPKFLLGRNPWFGMRSGSGAHMNPYVSWPPTLTYDAPTRATYAHP